MSANLLTMIVPVKDGASALHLRHPRVEQIEIHGELESIAHAFLGAITKADTPWVILGNDDITISPQNPAHASGFTNYPDNDWVSILEDEIAHLNDPYWLLHPDDGCFGQALSIFPILNRQVVLDHANLLIPPFKRYCLDPHLHMIFKLIGRVKYVERVLFDHQNFYTDDTLPDWAQGVCYGKHGRRYCVKPGPACDADHELAGKQPIRMIAQTLLRKIQQHTEQACGRIDVRPRQPVQV